MPPGGVRTSAATQGLAVIRRESADPRDVADPANGKVAGDGAKGEGSCCLARGFPESLLGSEAVLTTGGPVADKRMTEDEVVAELESGMTLGIGGWGSRRKPMSLVRAILRSGLSDLHVVSYGGPDVGLLCAAGKVSTLTYGFVSLDSIPLEPHFRAARQAGALEVCELDEGAFYLGLMAAAHRVPFYPTRAGLGTAMLSENPELRTVTSPYGEGEELVAIPALALDAAILHMNRADAGGNGQFLGPDLYFDDLFAMAAARTYMSAEKIVPTEQFLAEGSVHTLRIPRIHVDGVIEAPQGAHFTQCPPDYGRDEAFQAEYAAAARDPERWVQFRGDWLELESHDQYRARLAARADA